MGGDITQGLPRVEEIFERRVPKMPAIVSKVNGRITSIKEEGAEKTIIIMPNIDSRSSAKKGKQQIEYVVPYGRMLLAKVDNTVKKGDILTDGSADIAELFKYAGIRETQEYIIGETIKIYELQGASTARKHMEVIIKQMMSRYKIKSNGQTKFSTGEIVEDFKLREENQKMEEEGLEEAKAERLVLGITEVSLTRESFLSSVSFQNTTRMLINASIRGAQDNLVGLKENIIVGRLVPTGSGFKGSKKWKMVQAVDDPEEE